MSQNTTPTTGSSSAGNASVIHPISEGGSVTWANHNDLVFREGKDRGPRDPPPTLPDGYKSRGPLANFPFHKLRGNNNRKRPVTRFMDEYSGKQDNTPTELVAEILAYFNKNEDDHMNYLLERGQKIQNLNDTIRVQEEEISRMAEQINSMPEEIRTKDEEINGMAEQINDKDEEISCMAEETRTKNEEISRMAEEIRTKDEVIRTKNQEINSMAEQIRTQDEDIGNKDQVMKGMAAEISNMAERSKNKDEEIKELEANRQRKRERPSASQSLTDSGRVGSNDDLKATVNNLKASLLESTVRVLLLKAKGYIDSKEYPAAEKVVEQAEGIMVSDLPTLEVLHGKVLYWNGRAKFELKLWRAAVREFTRAQDLGFNANCEEVGGDCVEEWFEKARLALHEEGEG